MKSTKVEDKKLLEFLERTVWSKYSDSHKELIAHFMEESLKNPKVGIFWLVPSKKLDDTAELGEWELIFYDQDVLEAEHYDVYYSSTVDHYVYWSTVKDAYPAFKNDPYEKYPRGRVTLVSDDYRKGGTFKIMADLRILHNPECIEEIKKAFNISNKYKVEILPDSHYRLATALAAESKK